MKTLDDTAVRDLLQRTVAAWTANDAGAYADLYTADATVVLADGTYLRNRAEIRAHVAAGFAGRLRGSTGFDEAESIRFAGPDAAIALTRSGFIPPGGTDATIRRATWTLVREPDGWRVAGYANGPLT